MSKYKVPCFYVPTQVVFVDDSEHFLAKIVLQIHSNSPYVTFSNPEKALNFINEGDNFSNVIRKVINPNVESLQYGINTQEYETRIRLSPLYELINNPHRFDTPTVLVVDYAMPDIDGIEFCKKITNPRIKKVMLTGQANESLAVVAFNDGIIDKFISKKSSNTGELIDNAISELQKELFYEVSLPIRSVITTQFDSWLSYSNFDNVFEDILKDNNIVEYYLLDNYGSFLLIDANGKRHWLIATTQAELNDYCVVAKDHDAPSACIKLMETGKKIPFFSSAGELMNTEGKEWEAYLYDAVKVSSEPTYYYALVSGEDILNVNDNNFVSLNKYLNDYWPPT